MTEPTALLDLRAAKSALETAESNALSAAKRAIKEGLRIAFEDPTVNSVVFGISTAPYNDENAGQGVFGPLVNSLSDDEEFSRDEEYELFYDRSGSREGAISALYSALQEAGWKLAGESLGLHYYESEGHGEQAAFVATRNSDGSYDLQEIESYY